MTDKERIEKEAEEYASKTINDANTDENTLKRIAKADYIAGATAEHKLIAEQLKQERNKAIDECLAEYLRCLSNPTASAKVYMENIESLKQ